MGQGIEIKEEGCAGAARMPSEDHWARITLLPYLCCIHMNLSLQHLPLYVAQSELRRLYQPKDAERHDAECFDPEVENRVLAVNREKEP